MCPGVVSLCSEARVEFGPEGLSADVPFSLLPIFKCKPKQAPGPSFLLWECGKAETDPAFIWGNCETSKPAKHPPAQEHSHVPKWL